MTSVGTASMGFSTRLLLGLYQFFWHLALPVALLRLLWKSRLQKEYRTHINERLGFSWAVNDRQPRVWVHAVSVGETRAAAPLIESLINQGESILLTHMTPTGRATGQQIFAEFIQTGQLVQSYLPYDISWAVKSFYRHFSIKLGLIMETEVWPTLVLVAQKNSLPIVLVNARLSERSARRISRFKGFAKTVYGAFYQILAQTNLDAKRYSSLDLQNIQVTGNLKFDVQANSAQIDQALHIKKLLPTHLQIVCAASTREGEEELIIQAWEKLAEHSINLINARLLIVPRHPQRFEAVFQLLQNHFDSISRRSTFVNEQNFAESIVSNPIILGDSMGEMSLYYALSDFVIMGGSLQPLGGQNFIEACALGRPIILGEHTFNFQQASADVIDANAAIRIFDEEDLVKAVDLLLSNQTIKESMSACALDFASQHTGATQKILQVVQSIQRSQKTLAASLNQ